MPSKHSSTLIDRQDDVAALIEENSRLNDALEETRVLFQDMIYAVSHDLGAPLRAITSFSAILQERYTTQLDSKAQSYLGYIAGGGNKAQQMLNALLDYSRVQTQGLAATETPLDEIFMQAWQELADKIASSGAVVQSARLPRIAADRAQMRQLFHIIIDNALTYRARDERPHINIHAEQTGAGWSITVTDNGIGVSEVNCMRVFQPFKRLHHDADYPGLGMGLSIARRIVERHGGRIGLRPAAPCGTTCWFMLPTTPPFIKERGNTC